MAGAQDNQRTYFPLVAQDVASTPTAPPGELAFMSARSSSEHPGNQAALAIDGDPATFWRPADNPPAGSYLELDFSVPQTVLTVRFLTAMGEAVATATATVGPGTATATPAGTSFRVSLLRPAVAAGPGRAAQDNDCYSSFVHADRATVQLSCSEAFAGVTGVRIYLDAVGDPAAPPGIREVAAYPPGRRAPPAFGPAARLSPPA